MTCDRNCSTCFWWSNQEPALATGVRRAAGADPEIGVCTIAPPVVVRMAGMHGSYFPETFASRCCGSWSERGGNGPDGGESVPIDLTATADGTVTPFRKVSR